MRVLGFEPGAVSCGGSVGRIEAFGDDSFPGLGEGEGVEGGAGLVLEGWCREPAVLLEAEFLEQMAACRVRVVDEGVAVEVKQVEGHIRQPRVSAWPTIREGVEVLGAVGTQRDDLAVEQGPPSGELLG